LTAADKRSASRDLAKRLVSCNVVDDAAMHDLSDHNSVVAVFDV
jgi:hypothetical protein